MLLTGSEDYRTPMSETEQFYQALKLRKIDTAMVRIPGASTIDDQQFAGRDLEQRRAALAGEPSEIEAPDDVGEGK